MVQYVNVCFETGKLYWYYYENDNGEVNQMTRMKSAVEWFQDVINNAPPDYENLGMVQVYFSVGEFYRDIAINAIEASDKGMYAPFFEKISILADEVLQDEKESDIVKLELLELARGAMQQYATKVKADGITLEQQLSLYEKIKENVKKIEVTTETTEEIKNSIVDMLDDTYVAIKIAYET